MPFRYDKFYHKLAADEFVRDFFQSESVKESFEILSEGEEWIGVEEVSEISCASLSATLTNMSFFDKFQNSEAQIVRQNGSIIKCMDEYYDGFQVSDKLRDYFLNEESENLGLYDEKEEQEFLYHIFRHLVIGGSICQFEVSCKVSKNLHIRFLINMVFFH